MYTLFITRTPKDDMDLIQVEEPGRSIFPFILASAALDFIGWEVMIDPAAQDFMTAIVNYYAVIHEWLKKAVGFTVMRAQMDALWTKIIEAESRMKYKGPMRVEENRVTGTLGLISCSAACMGALQFTKDVVDSNFESG